MSATVFRPRGGRRDAAGSWDRLARPNAVGSGGRRPGPNPVVSTVSREVSVSPRLWAWPGYVTLALGVALTLADPGLVTRLRYVPLLASLVLFGMPHGAVDHLIPGWVSGRRLGPAVMARLIGGYVGLTVVGITVWLVAPLVALAAFLAVTVVHWGAADLPWSGAQPRPRAFVLARGAAVVLVPALAFPHAFSVAAAGLLAPFLAHPPALALRGVARLLAAVALGVLAAVGAGVGWRARLELVGLLAAFCALDPVFGVGLYFVAWHSWRHLVRLATLEPAAARALEHGRPLAALGRILGAAVPCSVLALLGLLGFGLMMAVHLGSARQVTAVALALIAALTVPHAVVIGWLDVRVGVVGSRAARGERPRHDRDGIELSMHCGTRSVRAL